MIHESDYSYFDLHSKTNPHAVIFLPNAPGVLLGNILKLLRTDFCGVGLEILGNTVQTAGPRSRAGQLLCCSQCLRSFSAGMKAGASGAPGSTSPESGSP